MNDAYGDLLLEIADYNKTRQAFNDQLTTVRKLLVNVGLTGAYLYGSRSKAYLNQHYKDVADSDYDYALQTFPDQRLFRNYLTPCICFTT